MASGAVASLDARLSAAMRVLELGSGASTGWYAGRVGHITSVEPDPEWYERTKRAISAHPNVQLLHGPVSLLAPELLHSDMFDVVVVDHCEDEFTRCDALRSVGDSVSLLVLDDSDRYPEADTLMCGWVRERYVSFRSWPMVPTETTIYLR
jgi:hypothetical protein